MDVDWGRLLDDKSHAADIVGQMLHQGELALLVGAGISYEIGAPGWHLLARAMMREAKLKRALVTHKTPAAELAGIFSEIQAAKPGNFDLSVKKWLYFRWNKKNGNWASDTLVALGSLMTGNNRGRVDTVLSLNFDSFLEMYLRLYGFIPQPVTTFPCILKRADVTIFHSHGYLPLESDDGFDSSILLNEQSYLETLGETDNPAKRMLDYVLGHKRILAVGVSGDDTISRAALAALAKRSPGPLMGFWIVGPKTPSTKIASLKASKIAAIRMNSFGELPEFLFSVARRAAALTRI